MNVLDNMMGSNATTQIYRRELVRVIQERTGWSSAVYLREGLTPEDNRWVVLCFHTDAVTDIARLFTDVPQIVERVNLHDHELTCRIDDFGETVEITTTIDRGLK